ncbi:uncharacterized protein ARMOST_02032 [Armillaria ostoyae]|uniref:F-box domain-containing protein n=1 Tax=Armillaria ostoyae TaxID=47428 RepID=A0A284QQP5_ARMOS|nr:uncharacterized protein ARMOST_02032 [Armillaria ostoyae]
MNATDAMLHLDAVARSIPEPVLPLNALNSQISGILRATRPFLDTDRDWILQNIEIVEQQLPVYDALLKRIDEVRLDMQRHRDAVHKSMTAYSSTLAPIRRLPRELFRAVFREVQNTQWCNLGGLESESESKDYQVLDFSQGPWKLSHVCGAWRDIVLSYPQLWSHLVLQYWSTHPTETLHHTVPALQVMIPRSAQHPLDIVFELEDDDKQDAAVQVFPMILEESYRWRSMVLQIPLTLLEQMKMVREKIPCLESLTMKTLWISYHSREELPEDIRSAFIDAPRLQKVVLDRTHGFGNFMFPHHITHLATYMSNVSDLEAYQSLVECHFIDEYPDVIIDIPHPIHLPNVRRLFVSSSQLLSYLHLPSLDNLMICSLNESDSVHDVVSVMNEFVHRSRCSLTSLSIHNSVSYYQVFIEDCLLLMDSLVSLEIGFIRRENAMFDALTSIGFLPNLQHLSLLILTSIEPSLWDQLTTLISSRSRYLRSIRISCGDSDDVERINEYLEPLQLPELSMVVSWESYTEAISYYGKFECA